MITSTVNTPVSWTDAPVWSGRITPHTGLYQPVVTSSVVVSHSGMVATNSSLLPPGESLTHPYQDCSTDCAIHCTICVTSSLSCDFHSHPAL